MIINEMDNKRQALIGDMIMDCNNEFNYLRRLVEDYVWLFKEEMVELLYNELI
jgi:hypothetical protein